MMDAKSYSPLFCETEGEAMIAKDNGLGIGLTWPFMVYTMRSLNFMNKQKEVLCNQYGLQGLESVIIFHSDLCQIPIMFR